MPKAIFYPLKGDDCAYYSLRVWISGLQLRAKFKASLGGAEVPSTSKIARRPVENKSA